MKKCQNLKIPKHFLFPLKEQIFARRNFFLVNAFHFSTQSLFCVSFSCIDKIDSLFTFVSIYFFIISSDF